MPISREKLIEGFLKVPTGNVCDAMVQLGVPLGVIQGLHALDPNQRQAVGVAVTVKQMERHQTAEAKNLATHSKVIDGQLEYGDFLVLDVGGRTDVCSGGALLARRAKMQGASGFIVNGCLRDIREIGKLDFPVHLLAGSPIKSSLHLQTVGVNIPVEVRGVQINPGDVIITDDTGIVVLPAQSAESVLAKALEINSKEVALESLISEGKSFAEAATLVNL